MSDDKTVRVGVIGTGFGTRVVVPSFEETDGCEVVGVVSARDQDAARALCARPDLDLVSVHAPPFMHLEYVRAAVEAGHAVLCDKPFGRNAADAEEMLALADAAGVLNLLNFEFRAHPARQRLRSLIAEGAIGEVEHLHATLFNSSWSRNSPLGSYGWQSDATRGGGFLGAWGSHTIDFVRWAVGEITPGGAVLRTDVQQRKDRDGEVHDCTADDGFTAWMRAGENATVTFDATGASPVNVPQRFTVIGRSGAIEVMADHIITLRDDTGRVEEFEIELAQGDPHTLPMRYWLPVVRDAVRTGVVPEDAPTFADGVACVRVMDQLRKSR